MYVYNYIIITHVTWTKWKTVLWPNQSRNEGIIDVFRVKRSGTIHRVTGAH